MELQSGKQNKTPGSGSRDGQLAAGLTGSVVCTVLITIGMGNKPTQEEEKRGGGDGETEFSTPHNTSLPGTMTKVVWRLVGGDFRLFHYDTHLLLASIVDYIA